MFVINALIGFCFNVMPTWIKTIKTQGFWGVYWVSRVRFDTFLCYGLLSICALESGPNHQESTFKTCLFGMVLPKDSIDKEAKCI